MSFKKLLLYSFNLEIDRLLSSNAIPSAFKLVGVRVVLKIAMKRFTKADNCAVILL